LKHKLAFLGIRLIEKYPFVETRFIRKCVFAGIRVIQTTEFVGIRFKMKYSFVETKFIRVYFPALGPYGRLNLSG
jgi:hypothetical protein